MNTFYIIDSTEAKLSYPEGHLAEKIAIFLNKAINFSSLKKYKISKLAVVPAGSAGSLELAFANQHLFTLNLISNQEAQFIELYEQYQIVLNKKTFVNFILSANHPVGEAFLAHEKAEQTRLGTNDESKIRKYLNSSLTNFLDVAPNFFLSEMKFYMQIVPNRCRVRVRYAHFKY
jgi:hypothetical protein